jgi:energy-coupling factor transporter ATP-binding protein EcfA2
MKVYRYPGVRPFEATDSALFFGRDRDIADLYEMIRAERLVVLFGKSGYGKSSLLNAGVLPRLKGVMTPLEIRLGEYIAGQSPAPVDNILRKTQSLQRLRPDAAYLAALPVTLWTHFKQLDSAEKGAYLLVFDQFEEFFSYPADQQRAFRDQLADLLNGELPEDLRETARALDRDQRRQLTAPMDIRVLFSIRSDRMHELDRLKDRLPAILHKRYELKALSRDQAREAIIGPAALIDPRPDIREGRTVSMPMKDAWVFASPPFEYGKDALTRILAGLAVSNTSQQTGVEAFQLQIICDSIEGRVDEGMVRAGSGSRPTVTAADLPDFTEVFGQYYERRLALLPEDQRGPARLVIEDGLVRYDPATDEGRRLSVDGQALLKDFEGIGLRPELLRELENTFLVRREPNTLGGHNYELSHDT